MGRIGVGEKGDRRFINRREDRLYIKRVSSKSV